MGLTARQKLFAEHYVVKFDAQDAAIKAGYAPKNIKSMAYQLLGNDKIQEYISELTKKFSQNNESLKRMVLDELVSIATSNLQDYGMLTEDGLVIADSENWDPKKARVVQEFSSYRSQKGTSVKIKLYDKIKALEMIGRHLGMFTDKVEIELPKPTIIEKRDGTKVIMAAQNDENTVDAEVIEGDSNGTK